MTERLKEEKKRLIESLGVFFEQEKLTPPLAGRIKALLIINGERGTSFDELVNDLGAGKSTISNHLNNLISQGNVHYFTKSGDRKRYFAMTTGYIARKIKAYTKTWKREIEIHKQILDYKTKFNKTNPEEQTSLAKHQQSVEFLTDSVKYFEKENKKYTE